MRKRLAWLFGLMLWSACGLAPAATEMPQGLPEAFTAARHAIEAQGEEHIARNHRNEQRFAFRDGGISVSAFSADSEEGPGWSWGLRLTGYGTVDDVQAVADPERHIEGTRLEYRRGPITEWYENKPVGLEQGFTLRQPPAPGATDLVLVLALQGGLRAAWETPGQSVSFHTAAGDYALTYRDLKVIDAAGESVPARLALGPDRLEVHVDARDAAWPIVVDPLLVNQQARLTAADVDPGFLFGRPIALSGNTALVCTYGGGSFGRSNCYVFTRTGSTWTQQAKLTAAVRKDNDRFGRSIALSGNTALVGADGDDDKGFLSGSAYVFVRSGNTWTQQANLTAADGAPHDYFGWSVALSGDTALVGAISGDNASPWLGRVYVFTRAGSTWTQQAKLTPPRGAWRDRFGWSVALSGNTALVGAHFDQPKIGDTAGAAYVFTRRGNTWTQQAKLTAADTFLFGISIALSGDTALVGADSAYVAAGGRDAGAAYVFTRAGSTWTQQAKLTAPRGALNERFGWSVALSGTTALVGARTLRDEGLAYVFTRKGSTWTQQAKLTAADTTTGEDLDAVALSGDTALVSASKEVDKCCYGEVYVFQFGFDDTIPDFAEAYSISDVREEYSGSVRNVVSNCSQSELNGTYFGTLQLSIVLESGNTFSGTAAGTYESEGEQATEYVQLSGTINETGKLTGTTTHTFLATGGEGTFTGQLTGNTLSIVNTGHDTYGETCSYTRYLSADRNSTAYSVPDAKANGLDGPVVVPYGSNLRVEVSLNPQDHQGVYADWWAAAYTPSGWYSYLYPDDAWVYVGTSPVSLVPTFQGALTNIPSFEIVNTNWLSTGQYVLYFGIDTLLNGFLDLDQAYYDKVVIDIQ